MKKLLKLSVSVVLVISMILSLGAIGFAANLEANPDVISSHVEFIADETSVYARAFVRDYSAEPKDAVLIFAVYEDKVLTEVKKSTPGINAIIKTEALTLPENDNAEIEFKAFVWESESGRIVSNVATYSLEQAKFDAIVSGMKIKANGEGIPLTEFADGVYEMDLTEYTESVTLPEITVEGIEDNGVIVNIATDLAKKESLVSVGYGAMTPSEVTVNTLKGSRPGYSFYKEYTIKYVTYEGKKDANKFYDSALTQKSTSNITTGNSSPFKYGYSRNYFKADGVDYQEIVVDFDKYISQGTAIVINPVDENGNVLNVDKSIGNIVFKDAQGTAFVPEDNKYISEGHDEEGNDIYGKWVQRAITAKVLNPETDAETGEVTYTEETTPMYMFLCENFHATDKKYDTGSMVVTDRYPLTSGGKAIYEVADEDVVGGLYLISGSTSRTPQSGGKIQFAFYADCSVRVDIYSYSALNMLAAEGSGWTTKYNNKAAVTTYYQNFVPLLSAAYLVKNGDLSLDDTIFISQGPNSKGIGFRKPEDGLSYPLVSFTTDEEGVAAAALTVETKSGTKEALSLFSTSGGNSSANITLQNYKTIIQAIIDLYGDMASNVVVSENTAIDPNLTISNDVLAASTDRPVIRKFDYTQCAVGDTLIDYSVYFDRPLETPLATGALTSYPAIFNLKGAEQITGAMGWLTDNDAPRTEYNNSSNEWYSFKVKEPSEIMIFTSAGNKYYSDLLTDTTEAAKWVKISTDIEDSITSYANNQQYFQKLVVRKTEGNNEEIKIYCPNDAYHYLIFVKPIN